LDVELVQNLKDHQPKRKSSKADLMLLLSEPLHLSSGCGQARFAIGFFCFSTRTVALAYNGDSGIKRPKKMRVR
jgi:hypothetical protein